MKADDGVSEVLGFVLIFGLLLVLAGILSAGLLPGLAAEEERKQNTVALSAFAELKAGMDTLALAEKTGIYRTVTLADAEDTARISLSYGKDFGNGYREAVITYAAENVFAEDVYITLDSSGLKQNGKLILPAGVLFAVDPAVTAEQMDISGIFRVEYTWLGSFQNAGREICIFSVRLI